MWFSVSLPRPPARRHGCFLKIQNHLSISHSGLGCSFFHLSERRRNQTSLELLPRSRGAREWQTDRLRLQVSLPAAAGLLWAWFVLMKVGIEWPRFSRHQNLNSRLFVGAKMHQQTRWRVILHCLYLLRLVKYLRPHLQSYVRSSVPVFSLGVLIKRRV